MALSWYQPIDILVNSLIDFIRNFQTGNPTKNEKGAKQGTLNHSVNIDIRNKRRGHKRNRNTAALARMIFTCDQLWAAAIHIFCI